MKKQAKREAKANDDCSTEGAGSVFPTSVILSIVTGIQLCEGRGEVVECLEYLHSKKMTAGAAQKAAIAPAIEWIVSHLPWTAQAASSIKRSKGDVASWLARQTARHGAIHALPPMPTKAAMLGLQPLWMKLNNEVCDSVGKLMKLAKSGDENARHALFNLAVGVTRRLHKCHQPLIPLCHEFPVVLPAELEKREEALKACKLLPIGTKAGYPQASAKRHPQTFDKSPVGFWREVQFWIDSIRGYAKEFPCSDTALLCGEGDSFNVPIPLQSKIAALPDFGSGNKDEWFGVACELVSENPDDLIPSWVRDLTTAGRKQTKQRGLGAAWKDALRKGFGYCWDSRK